MVEKECDKKKLEKFKNCFVRDKTQFHYLVKVWKFEIFDNFKHRSLQDL